MDAQEKKKLSERDICTKFITPAITDAGWDHHHQIRDAVLDAFGKNEHVKKVFWTFFLATAGLVLAQVLDPDTAQRIVGMIAGINP
jgi:hypothetical protein